MQVKARILFIDYAQKTIGLSLLPSIVSWIAHDFGSVSLGDIMKARVSSVDANIGMHLQLQLPSIQSENGPAAFVHISNVSDAHVDNLQKVYKPQQEVTCRVVGFNALDALVVVSLKTSVIEQSLMLYSDIKVMGSDACLLYLLRRSESKR